VNTNVPTICHKSPYSVLITIKETALSSARISHNRLNINEKKTSFCHDIVMPDIVFYDPNIYGSMELCSINFELGAHCNDVVLKLNPMYVWYRHTDILTSFNWGITLIIQFLFQDDYPSIRFRNFANLYNSQFLVWWIHSYTVL